MCKENLFPVREHAVALRLNRAMAEDGYRVRKARGQRAVLSVGQWYVMNTTYNIVTQTHVNLEELGREWNVLRDWETVAE